MAGAGEDEGDEGEGEGVRAGEVAFVGVRRGCGCEGGLEGDMASEGLGWMGERLLQLTAESDLCGRQPREGGGARQ